MRVIVTGSRELESTTQFKTGAAVAKEVWKRLSEVHAETPITHLAHGGAKGIDRIAHSWAVAHDVPVRVYKPRWRKVDEVWGTVTIDYKAGFKRNWWMLFTEAGDEVAADFDRKTGRVALLTARIHQLQARAKRKSNTLRIATLTRMEVIITSPFHEERRELLRKLRVHLPDDARVIAFHDGESRGTAHCILAAHVLGYEVQTFRYDRVKREAPVDDRAKIDHKPGHLPALGTGRRFKPQS